MAVNLQNGVGSEQFDRICWMPPAPATGVIRRHPISNGYAAIVIFAEVSPAAGRDSRRHLAASETRRHAGLRNLFYSAVEENSQQIRRLSSRGTAGCATDATGTQSPGQQNLPGVEEGDGFFTLS